MLSGAFTRLSHMVPYATTLFVSGVKLAADFDVIHDEAVFWLGAYYQQVDMFLNKICLSFHTSSPISQLVQIFQPKSQPSVPLML